jgi:hypothetical protein
MANTRYVRRSSTKSGWDVVKEGHARATSHAATKRAAVREAAKAVRREGGGEVRVLNRTGKITDANTVRPRKGRTAA